MNEINEVGAFYVVAAIVMYHNRVTYEVRHQQRGITHSGSNSLNSTNGCYDSLLSNVMNLIAGLPIKVNEFIMRKG
jgi:hypothetical protein